ncbi:glutathione S-transferase N-terminal domain-containing protein [Fluviispira multicolorata]|uniref:4a-hydroxytetrahydrobiopterin dehydratase n=1 Tax=Fluviispira multicolorata TaxID=2654512 RepID=A0A833JCT6_9BACT|nr:glutathione S-transferase N-terminal domain-containing protein [Fluviispira multicolorata]KAB8027387.1 hypothetical protein GCL57_14415 [Fluviispira multicolorata]
MKIYTIPDCPFCFRVKIALKIRKIVDYHIEIQDIDLKNPPKDFLDISPNKTVPALELSQGNGFSDSMLIVEYLDSIQGKGERLYASTLDESMKIKMLIELLSENVTKTIAQILFTNGSAVEERKALAKVPIAFYELEKLLNKKDKRFLGGNNLNAADIHLIPFALYYIAAEKLLKKWISPEKNSKVEKYFNDILFHSAIRKAIPSIEELTHFISLFFTPKSEIQKIKSSSRKLVDDISEELVNLNESIRKYNSTQMWHRNENNQGSFIETVFHFKSYEDAIKAIQTLCDVQETADHHAKFTLDNFSQLKVEVCTHEPNWGVTSMDFAFAEVLTSRIFK